MTLQTLLSTVQTAVGAVTGVKYAPDYPPDQPGDFPFVVTYLGEFRHVQNTTEDFRSLYNVIVELHVARKDLPEDVYALLPYMETVTKAIINALLTNNYAYGGTIEGTFGVLNWGEPQVQTLGFRWTVRDVKVLTAL